MSAESGNENFNCPTCERTFDTKKGRSVHHHSAHGESIAKSTKECVVCGDEFTTYFDDQKACSVECKGPVISESKNEGLTEECRWCGSTVDIERWERDWKDYWFCDMDCKGSYMETITGKDHPSWKGGYPKRGADWRDIRKEVLERDGHSCMVCGATSDDVDHFGLHVHHIVKLRKFEDIDKANSMDNLVTLCPAHHVKVEDGSLECPKPGEIDE